MPFLIMNPPSYMAKSIVFLLLWINSIYDEHKREALFGDGQDGWERSVVVGTMMFLNVRFEGYERTGLIDVR